MTDTTDTASDPTDSTDSIGYAEALEELDAILDELDDDGIDIDVLSARVERAAELIAICRGRISIAQERVAGIVASLETTEPSPADHA